MWGRKLNGEGGGRTHGRMLHPDRQGDGDQEQQNQQGVEDIGDDEDQEQSTQSVNNEDGGNQVIEVEGLVCSVDCRDDLLQHKSKVMKQEDIEEDIEEETQTAGLEMQEDKTLHCHSRTWQCYRSNKF